MWVAESTEFRSLVSCSVCVTDLGSMLTTALFYLVARPAEILRRGRGDTWTKKRTHTSAGARHRFAPDPHPARADTC